MEQTAISCGQVGKNKLYGTFIKQQKKNKILNPSLGVQAKVSELEEEMMQLQPDIVDVQRQPWRSGEALDTL